MVLKVTLNWLINFWLGNGKWNFKNLSIIRNSMKIYRSLFFIRISDFSHLNHNCFKGTLNQLTNFWYFEEVCFLIQEWWMKFLKSLSKWVKNSKKGTSLVLRFLQKVATLPNFGHDKLAMLLKFGHGNRATETYKISSILYMQRMLNTVSSLVLWMFATLGSIT